MQLRAFRLCRGSIRRRRKLFVDHAAPHFRVDRLGLGTPQIAAGEFAAAGSYPGSRDVPNPLSDSL